MAESMAFRQFLACAALFWEVPDSAISIWNVLPSRTRNQIQHWYDWLWLEIRGGKSGYPKNSVLKTPATEEQLRAIVSTIPDTKDWRLRLHHPTLCLTHDIDYLAATLQMNLKRIVSQRRLIWTRPGQEFLTSLSTLLKLDRDIAGKEGASTLFLSCKQAARTWHQRSRQWLIDPSYKPDGPLFDRLRSLIENHSCEVGLHGSYFSLSDDLLSAERFCLGSILNRKIVAGRQHWLNLPGTQAMNKIRASGLNLDSTLGWNGAVGFRGGFARPFPLLLPAGSLWELPLLLMDGPMFDDLALDTEAVVRLSIELLEQVFRRQGCVAINWHDRSAHPQYSWSEAYTRILDWAVQKGFQFGSATQAVEGYARSISRVILGEDAEGDSSGAQPQFCSISIP